MESQAKLLEDKKRREDNIRKQIAALKAQLPDTSNARTPSPPPPPKRSREITLAPATPSPKKKKQRTEETRAFASASASSSLVRKQILKPPDLVPQKPAPSNLLSKLAHTKLSGEEDEAPSLVRSMSLKDRPAERQPLIASTRDDNLALIEAIEPGPYDHHPPFDDPNFDKLEPHSGIRLSARSLPHDDLQEIMTGRFYISPSHLYSVVRLTPDKHGYDVPVCGDWLTIAVVAERGPINYTRAPIPLEPDDIQRKGKGKTHPPKPSGKKYVVMKLVDFGSGAKSSSSATGGKAIVRGDACLSLFLFESDNHSTMTEAGSSRSKKVYKGGSGGAFESLSKMKEGDVILLMNPKIMKPNQGARNGQNNMLGLNPESAESITVLGRASDLGLCPAVKRDGTTCHSWYDKRVAQACDWHIQDAVQRRRASRPEFSVGTTGMSNSTKKKKVYDPARQWGLKPENEPSATYVIGGHVARGSGSHSADVGERMGREAQAKAQRKLAIESDKMLKSLLDRDKDGMRAVMSAREFMSKQEADNKTGREKEKRKNHTERHKDQPRKQRESRKDKTGVLVSQVNMVKNSFNAETIKRLGFDPTSKPGQRLDDADDKMQGKLDRLSAVQSSRTISLGRRPKAEKVDQVMVDLDD